MFDYFKLKIRNEIINKYFFLSKRIFPGTEKKKKFLLYDIKLLLLDDKFLLQLEKNRTIQICLF
jgi:hypothetical protein